MTVRAPVASPVRVKVRRADEEPPMVAVGTVAETVTVVNVGAEASIIVGTPADPTSYDETAEAVRTAVLGAAADTEDSAALERLVRARVAAREVADRAARRVAIGLFMAQRIPGSRAHLYPGWSD